MGDFSTQKSQIKNIRAIVHKESQIKDMGDYSTQRESDHKHGGHST
jgi:hypothetical protein